MPQWQLGNFEAKAQAEAAEGNVLEKLRSKRVLKLACQEFLNKELFSLDTFLVGQGSKGLQIAQIWL